MSQLEVVSAERLADFAGTTSAAYVTVSNPVLPAASFVPGKQYLLIARSEPARDVAGGTPAGIRLVHGTTEFPGSEMLFTSFGTGASQNVPYAYLTVWTAGNEQVAFQAKSNGAANTWLRYTTLTAIRLSDALVEGTDWLFAETTTPVTLTTAFQTGASLTFTPAVAGQTWLLWSDARLEHDALGDLFVGRLDRTGEVAAGWETQRAARAVGEAHPYPMLVPLVLGAVAQTFRAQAKRIGTTAATARRTRSAVFALRLAALDVVSLASDDSHVDVSVNTFGTTVATVGHTPVVVGGRTLLLGFTVFDPGADTAQRYYQARVQRDQVDALSSDGFTNDYTSPPTAGADRFHYPASGVTGQMYPYLHASIETPSVGPTTTLDLDVGISSANTGRGVKYRRLLALSLEATAFTPPPPPPGGVGTLAPERNDQIMYQNDYSTVRRRARLRLRLAADNVSPATGEAGGQPTVSVNGGAYTSTGVGVLVAEDAANGLYYCDVGQSNLASLGSIRVRYGGPTTEVLTLTLPIEELPWLDDGFATGGGANYIDRRAGAPAIAAGSLLRLVSGTGAGQSQVVLSDAAPRSTTEQNWVTAPVAGTGYLVLPGLPPVVPSVNVAQVNASVTAAQNLQAGADAMLSGAIVAGTNSPTTVTTNLPVTVNGVATPADFYKGRALYLRTGPQTGDVAIITGSIPSGATTVLTLDALAGTPGVGDTFVIT